MPKRWQGWPCAVEVAFTVTEICGVHGGLYKEYGVETCEEARENWDACARAFRRVYREICSRKSDG